MRVRFANGIKDVPITEVTKENYIVPRGEEDTYHCRIEQKQFDQRSGRRLSRPRIRKFEPKMYPAIARNLRQQGWDIEVLYDPTEFLKDKELKRQEMENLTYNELMELAAKRKAAERKALKDEIIAELRAAGMLKDPNPEISAPKGVKTTNPKKK